MVAFQSKKSKAKLFAGGVIKPEQVTTGVIEAETVASGAMVPISTGGGVISGGDTPPTPVVMYTFTINPTPADAVVTINDVQQSNITAEAGTTIIWRVSADGYTSQSGDLTLNENTTLDVVLEEVSSTTDFVQSVDYVSDGVAFTVDGSSSSAAAFALAWQNGFNNDFGVINKSDGERKYFDNYIYGSSVISDNKVINITFDEPKTVNKLYLSAYTGSSGTSYQKTITFTKSNGETFTRTVTFTYDIAPDPIDVGGEIISGFSFNVAGSSSSLFLAAIRVNSSNHTFGINPVQTGATVMINGVERSTIVAEYGSVINWQVSAEGYSTHKGKVTLVEDTVLNVDLAAWIQTGDLELDGIMASKDPNAGKGSITEIGTGLAGVWQSGADGVDTDGTNYVYSTNGYSSNLVRFKFAQLMKIKKIRAYGMCTYSNSTQNAISIYINKEGSLQTGTYNKNGGANTAFEILWEGEKEGDEIAIKLKSSNSVSGTSGYRAYLYSLYVEADYA